MRDFSSVGDLPCELLLNGLPMRSVRIRQNSDSEGNFDVLVNEPVLGGYSLHSGFDIQVPETEDAGWRRVSLAELKGILKSRYLLLADDLPKASEIAECRLFARVDDIEIPDWGCGRVSIRGRKEACVRFVERVFYRTGIPHLVAGTTFLVPSAPTARIPLKRAGFRQSHISPSALVEPKTGCSIQLVERDPRR